MTSRSVQRLRPLCCLILYISVTSAGHWPPADVSFWWAWASPSVCSGLCGCSLDDLTHLISCWHHTCSWGLLGFLFIPRLGGLFCGPWSQDLSTATLATSMEIHQEALHGEMGISGSFLFIRELRKILRCYLRPSSSFSLSIFWPCHVACGISAPSQGSNLCPL